MKSLIKSILVMFVAFYAFSYAQIFGTSGSLKIRNEYYGDLDVISIRVVDNTVYAYYKDSAGKHWNHTLFKLTAESEPYKEFLLDVLEKGKFTLIPSKTDKLEELKLIYKGRTFDFFGAALFLNFNDKCGLGMQCPTSNVAINDGRRTTTPGTKGPLRRSRAKDDYLTRVNIF